MSLYDLEIENELENLLIDVHRAMDKGSIVSFVKKKRDEKNGQMAFIHAMINKYSLRFNYTFDEAKTKIKRDLKCYYKKNNELYLKKMSEMTTTERSDLIEEIKKYCKSKGLEFGKWQNTIGHRC